MSARFAFALSIFRGSQGHRRQPPHGISPITFDPRHASSPHRFLSVISPTWRRRKAPGLTRRPPARLRPPPRAVLSEGGRSTRRGPGFPPRASACRSAGSSTNIKRFNMRTCLELLNGWPRSWWKTRSAYCIRFCPMLAISTAARTRCPLAPVATRRCGPSTVTVRRSRKGWSPPSVCRDAAAVCFP